MDEDFSPPAEEAGDKGPENGMHVNWIAVYEDDSVLPQVGEDGEENAYGDIDRSRLTEFRIWNTDTGKLVFVVSLTKDQRLVYRRRVSMSGVTGEVMWVIYLVGWQQTVKGVNVQSLNWLMPDGTIVNTGKYHEETAIFAEVQLLDFEEISY